MTNIFQVIANNFTVVNYPGTEETIYFEGNLVEIVDTYNRLRKNMKALLGAKRKK